MTDAPDRQAVAAVTSEVAHDHVAAAAQHVGGLAEAEAAAVDRLAGWDDRDAVVAVVDGGAFEQLRHNRVGCAGVGCRVWGAALDVQG